MGWFGDVFNAITGFENQRYQRNLQQQIFNREDTAIQRRVADLKAAGLSPTLATGQGASAGAVVSSSAPQVSSELGVLQTLGQIADYSHTKADTEAINQGKVNSVLNTMADIDLKASQSNNLRTQSLLGEQNVMGAIIDNQFKASMNAMNLSLMKSQLNLNDKQRNLIDSQIAMNHYSAQKLSIDAMFAQDNYDNMLNQSRAQTALINNQASLAGRNANKVQWDLDKSMQFNLRSNDNTSSMANDMEKYFALASSRMGLVDGLYGKPHGDSQGFLSTFWNLLRGY